MAASPGVGGGRSTSLCCVWPQGASGANPRLQIAPNSVLKCSPSLAAKTAVTQEVGTSNLMLGALPLERGEGAQSSINLQTTQGPVSKHLRMELPALASFLKKL